MGRRASDRDRAVKILVTNDDGVDAPGIAVLAAMLAGDGHDVLVVAPSTDRSGSGAALGQFWGSEPPPVTPVVWAAHPDLTVFSIDAPPGTAVLAAALGGFGDPPDLVVAGINPGANTGHLVVHSGTVGAALTGVGLDIPGIAVSLMWADDGPYQWDTAAQIALAAVDWAVKPDGGRPRLLNINVPNRALHELEGVQETELAPHGEVWVASADVSTGDLRLDFKPRGDAAPGTDVGALQAGYVSVTPLMSVVRAPIAGAAEAVRHLLSPRVPHAAS
ncbi:MAG: 5'/3'-nucleotidase SurE [Acidimicrobiia bacterium]